MPQLRDALEEEIRRIKLLLKVPFLELQLCQLILLFRVLQKLVKKLNRSNNLVLNKEDSMLKLNLKNILIEIQDLELIIINKELINT